MSTTAEETEKTTKTELLLDSLEIKGYRCFEHLTIEKLGRVNLIVGKNNVGKTALLEALWIYAESNSWDSLVSLLNIILERRLEKEKEKEDYSSNPRVVSLKLSSNVGLHFRNLFYKRPNVEISNEKNKPYFSINTHKELPFDFVDGFQPIDCIDVICSFNNNTCLVSSSSQHYHNEIKNLFISSHGLNIKTSTEIWDDIILQNEEDHVVEALQIIADRVKDLNFINYPKGSNQRVPVVRIADVNERVSLNSLGEGMNRLLGIALALVNCKDGILLIDEIESGLHYSILPDVWKLIFKTAKDLNVQVFATTHSKDCIEAFTQAAIEDEESDGMLIRLENKDGKIRAVNFNEDELETVERRNIEVR